MQSFLHVYFNQLHFPNESFPYFNELFFSSSTTNSRQLTKTTDTCHTTLLFFLLTKRHIAPEVLSSHAKIWVYAVGERALIIKKPLPWFTLYKKEYDNRAKPIVTFCPTKKLLTPNTFPSWLTHLSYPKENPQWIWQPIGDLWFPDFTTMNGKTSGRKWWINMTLQCVERKYVGCFCPPCFINNQTHAIGLNRIEEYLT